MWSIRQRRTQPASAPLVAYGQGKANISPSCAVCGGRKIYYNFSLGSSRVEGCATCGLMRLNPPPAGADSRVLGPSLLPGIGFADPGTQARALTSRTAGYYLDLLASYCRSPLSGTLLEVTCGESDLLPRASSRGLRVSGVSSRPSRGTVNDGRDGWPGTGVRRDLSDILASGEQFDFIVLTEILACVREPRALLRAVHALLRNDGVLLVAAPGPGSVPAGLPQAGSPAPELPHAWYFSPPSLTRLLHSEAFGGLKVSPAQPPVSAFGHLLGRLSRNASPAFGQRHPSATQDIAILARKLTRSAIPTLSVVMPAFNEAKTIRTAIDRVLGKTIDGLQLELIIVESNSTDGTREIVREYEGRNGVHVIWQDRPRGKGNAVRTGLDHVRGDYVLIQDADDEYDIEDYDSLVEPLMSGEVAFVLGARHGGGAWKMRQFEDRRLLGHLLNFGHWIFATLVNVVFRVRLKDPFTMYKVFRADCLRGIRFECDRFDFDFELLIKLVRSGYRPIEIPVNYRSRSFSEGKKVNVFRDPWTWLRAIVKYRLQAI